ncbi:MAG: biotin/lipoyl-binding protein [Gemmatimonadetes bacterium]|nr:biotin/lipoyl-binding protein [Gemmatimonadota bacterium]
MRYLVTIADRSFDIEVDGERVVVGGVEHTATLLDGTGTPVRNLLLDGSSWIVPMEPAGRGRWTVMRRGERFDVEVIDERTRHIRSLVGEGKGTAGPATLKAPMPGLVVRVLVAPGQTVAAGQPLLVLEAMKMENELKAPGQGVIAQVLVQPGQATEKGAPLVTFATPE